MSLTRLRQFVDRRVANVTPPCWGVVGGACSWSVRPDKPLEEALEGAICAGKRMGSLLKLVPLLDGGTVGLRVTNCQSAVNEDFDLRDSEENSCPKPVRQSTVRCRRTSAPAPDVV